MKNTHKCSQELLAFAQKEAQEDVLEALRTEYEKGKADSLKDLPRWKKIEENLTYLSTPEFSLSEGNLKMLELGKLYEIALCDLIKLQKEE